jgi:hypothetical protein
MKKILIPILVMGALLCLSNIVTDNHQAEAAKPAKPAAASCQTCHADFVSVFPKGHPPAKGNDLSACISCHAPNFKGLVQKNAFSARMHRAHMPQKGSLDCMDCHYWVPGKSFGLRGQKESWGAPKKDDMVLMKEMFSSWAGSNYTDNLHAKAGIVCTQCHGKNLPKADDTVENSHCLTCHGPMDKLAQKTESKDFKDRNPHKSHLSEIACAVCHKGHRESQSYCLDCHKTFIMKIPGAGK